MGTSLELGHLTSDLTQRRFTDSHRRPSSKFTLTQMMALFCIIQVFARHTLKMHHWFCEYFFYIHTILRWAFFCRGFHCLGNHCFLKLCIGIKHLCKIPHSHNCLNCLFVHISGLETLNKFTQLETTAGLRVKDGYVFLRLWECRNIDGDHIIYM